MSLPPPSPPGIAGDEEIKFGPGLIVITSLSGVLAIAILYLLGSTRVSKAGGGDAQNVGKYLTLYGSVIPRTIPWAMIGAAEGVLLKWATRVDPTFTAFNYHLNGGAWFHPYAFHVFGMMLGFALVMRIQIAYQRYWEGSTQCHLASSKWGDAIMQVMAFDEASKDAFSDEALEFRMLILHYTSLMNACALIDIRRDDDIDCPLTLNPVDPYLFRPNANHALLASGDGGASFNKASGRESLEILDSSVSASGEPKTRLSRSPTMGKISHRASTAPLQNLISIRRTVAEKLNTDVNSFEAFEADMGRNDQKAVPVSYGATAADIRCRARRVTTESSLFSHPAETFCTGTGVSSDTSRAKLRRGSLSKRDYISSAIFLRGDNGTLRRLAKANCFDVIGGVSQSEIDLLEPVASGDRAYIVQTWIVRQMTNRLAAGGLAIPPPLLSRTYQVLSDGTAAAMQARKVSYVAFPFPLRQLLVLLLLVFNIIAPMCVAAFMDSELLIGILTFFVCLGYQSLNEAAAELEHPFGLGANHLQLTAYQRQFNSKLAHLLDQTIPQLGYIPKARPPSPPAKGGAMTEASVPPRLAATKPGVGDGGKYLAATDGLTPAAVSSLGIVEAPMQVLSCEDGSSNGTTERSS